MTPNEINIIEREVAARLPYGLMVKYDLGNSYPYPKIGCVYLWHHNGFCSIYMVDKYPENWFPPVKSETACRWENVRPYLRPMNTMTDSERISFNSLFPMLPRDLITPDAAVSMFDWLNRRMFDYRDLIVQGLAIAAPDGMYDFSD